MRNAIIDNLNYAHEHGTDRPEIANWTWPYLSAGAEAHRMREREETMADQLPAEEDLGRLPTDKELARLQRTTVLYYLHETNPDNGLVRDKTDPDAPCSIAAVGLALATIPAVVERGVLIRKFAAKIARRRLRSLMNLPQGPEPDAAGHKGFFYHFLDIDTGRRVWNCELSTLDSAFLFAGALTCATYFDADTEDEAEVRGLADALYRRADWNWACNGGPTLTHGWKPETGFLPYRYEGYDEGLLLYLLALGSPTHPLPPESYTRTAPPTSGKKSTAASCSTPARCSHINFRTCGSISVASATRSCASVAATTSRTADRQPLCSRSTPSGTRWASRVTGSTVGGSRPVMARAGSSAR